MHRELAIAVFAATALACPRAEAQARGGSRMMAARPTVSVMRAHPAPVVAAAPRPAMIRPSRVVVAPNRFARSGVIINPRFHHHHHHHHFNFTSGCFGPFFDPFLCRQALFAQAPIWPSPVFWPDVPQANPVTQQTASLQSQPDADLRAAIDRLSQEVEMLRQEQQARNIPQQNAATAPEPHISTVLVFRDGHRTEVQNYGIVGQTLWIFSEQHARKVPIADLDLKATQQVNDERGVEFLGPAR